MSEKKIVGTFVAGGGGVTVVTVTVAVAVTEPALFVAVSVYVVVALGVTAVDPLAEAEVKVPGVILKLVAPAADQESVEEFPLVTESGLAVKEEIVGAVGGGVVVSVTVA